MAKSYAETGKTKGSDWAALGADIACAATPFLTGGGVAVRAANKADDAVKATIAVNKVTEKATEKTLKQATREAKQAAGIPKSQQPEKQKNGEQIYKVPKDGGGSELNTVIKQTKDRNHPEPHVEAGKVKMDESNVQRNTYGGVKLANGKKKVEYTKGNN